MSWDLMSGRKVEYEMDSLRSCRCLTVWGEKGVVYFARSDSRESGRKGLAAWPTEGFSLYRKLTPQSATHANTFTVPLSCFAIQFGNVNSQLEGVAAQLDSIEELSDGFDAIGFSQGMCAIAHLVVGSSDDTTGGQFLRAYVERYNSPPVHNLITFGSQHMGIADIPTCRPGDWTCQLARRAARAGVYTHWAQSNLVQVR